MTVTLSNRRLFKLQCYSANITSTKSRITVQWFLIKHCTADKYLDERNIMYFYRKQKLPPSYLKEKEPFFCDFASGRYLDSSGFLPEIFSDAVIWAGPIGWLAARNKVQIISTAKLKFSSFQAHTLTCTQVALILHREQWCILVTSLTLTLRCLKDTPHNCNCYKAFLN